MHYPTAKQELIPLLNMKIKTDNFSIKNCFNFLKNENFADYIMKKFCCSENE